MGFVLEECGVRKPLFVVCLLLVGMFPATSKADDEDFWQHRYCEGMKIEEHWPSGGRVDCLSTEFAVEIEWADDWAEAVGQSLYYAGATGSKAWDHPALRAVGRSGRGPVPQLCLSA